MSAKKRYNAKVLSIAFLAALMLPVVILAFTEHNPFWVTVVGLLLPLGAYALFAAMSHRSGRMVWLGALFLFFSAFQVVISYLFGESVVAADMFLNLLTTNAGEATELLGNIYPSIIAVCVIYIPILWYAAAHLRHGVVLEDSVRRGLATLGGVSLAVGCFVLWVGFPGRAKSILRDDVFPVNVCYNFCLSLSEAEKIENFKTTSQGFSYMAKRDVEPQYREIYVLVIGEASRAANWQLYGYERPTNPRLVARDDIHLFRGVTTQSNTTHKSVPMMLSSIHTSQHDELYRRSGLPALFREAGFTTYFISNQSPQGAMIDHLASDAHKVIYVDEPRYDAQMVEIMRKAIHTDPSPRMLFILHTYGSHFSYHQRYPSEFAIFRPAADVAITRKNVVTIRNAYDNSVLYTDYFLSEVVKTLEKYPSISSAMLYCSDHGEDLFDNGNGRFLHSSPTVTYYQLHVPALAWFSSGYRQNFGEKVEAAKANIDAPATTHSLFHTMADIASIRSPYVDCGVSLVNSKFDSAAERLYLDDHNNAVTLDEEIGIDATQRELFRRAGVGL